MNKKATRMSDGRKGASKSVKSGKQRRIDSLEHPSRRRMSIPTEQTERDIDHGGKDYHPRAPAAGEPRLHWDRHCVEPGREHAHALHIREKFSPLDMIQRLTSTTTQSRIFDSFNGFDPPSTKFRYYLHRSQGNWQNRLIRGDSARVMASLAALEGYAGEVQTIFFDPPYGIGFDSNFICAMRDTKRSKKITGHAVRPKDPVSVRAFSDTWDRGLDSYLDAMLHRLTIMKDLLTESGSIFVQIGPENVHRMAILLDEVFDHENKVTTIMFRKGGGTTSLMIPEGSDFILWYTKNKNEATKKYHQLYKHLTKHELIDHMSSYAMIEEPGNDPRNMTYEEKIDPTIILPTNKLLKREKLTAKGWSSTRSFDYTWNGVTYACPPNEQWNVSKEGMDNLAKIKRLVVAPSKKTTRLGWKMYEDEMPGKKINNQWAYTASAKNLRYSVQTSEEVIKRCILMSSDPGDLVLDPSGGSGATAVVAEQYGRRWIMIDSSHVSIATIRHQLAMRTYDWYLLQDSDDGANAEQKLGGKARKGPYMDDPVHGFVYERCPYVSASTLAYNKQADPILLVDRPLTQSGTKRLTGPFTVESETSSYTLSRTDPCAQAQFAAQVIAVMEKNGINALEQNVEAKDIEAAPTDRAYTHTGTVDGRKGAILIAPEFNAVDNRLIDAAVRDVVADKMDVLLVVAFEFQPLAADAPAGVRVTRVLINRALQQNEINASKIDRAFVVVAEPNIKIERVKDKPGKFTVTLVGYNTYDPRTGNTDVGTIEDVDCWMIDTEYDGESFYARDVHFPNIGTKWTEIQLKNIEKLLGNDIDREKWDHFTSLKSAPFSSDTGRIAVKIVTTTGDEMTREIALNGSDEG